MTKYISFILLGTTLLLFMSACNNGKKKSEESTADLFSFHPSDFQADFVAYAEDSTWKVSLIYDALLIFTNKAEKTQIRITNPKHMLAAGADALTVKGENEKNSIELFVDPTPCEDNKGYHMRISVKEGAKEILKGKSCGRYTGDKKLYNLWTLMELNGKKIQRSSFAKQPPFMEINLKDATVKGFGGCNDFSGNIQFGYDKTSIGPIMSTKMYCGDDSKVESELFEVLNKGFLVYTVDNKKLLLETKGVSAVFYKVD
jgi:heat shock protein HslJ